MIIPKRRRSLGRFYNGDNAKEPNLYDLIHYKWVDQAFQNLHSEIEIWMSCTTGQHFGPNIYLEHGSALWYGNAGTGLCPQETCSMTGGWKT